MPNDEFYSAGFYFTAPIPRPDWAHGSRSLLPDQIVTLSSCLATIVPSYWPSPANPPFPVDLEALSRLGIGLECARQIESFAARECEVDASRWPWRLSTLDAARAFGAQCIPRNGGAILLGVALPADCIDDFFEGIGERRTVSERGEVLAERLRDANGGEILGYEVLGDGLHEHHSIICTGGEFDLAREFGIVANSSGLIESLRDARTAADWASVDDHAESCPYFPWRLTRHAW